MLLPLYLMCILADNSITDLSVDFETNVVQATSEYLASTPRLLYACFRVIFLLVV